MKKFILVTALFFFAANAFCQEFPSGFAGHWQGELQWFKAGSTVPQKVNMQLIIQKTDTPGTWHWQLVYGKQSVDSRPYLLRAIDSVKGHWVVDERNGILLDHYWIGNRLAGSFSVEGTTILNSFRREGDSLVVEFYSNGSGPVRTSGGSNDIPAVNSFAAKAYQYAILKKRKD